MNRVFSFVISNKTFNTINVISNKTSNTLSYSQRVLMLVHLDDAIMLVTH